MVFDPECAQEFKESAIERGISSGNFAEVTRPGKKDMFSGLKLTVSAGTSQRWYMKDLWPLFPPPHQTMDNLDVTASNVTHQRSDVTPYVRCCPK